MEPGVWLNRARVALVACAAVAALLLARGGQALPAALLTFGVGAHGALWWVMYSERRRSDPS
jgi:hypothetical protein